MPGLWWAFIPYMINRQTAFARSRAVGPYDMHATGVVETVFLVGAPIHDGCRRTIICSHGFHQF